MTNKEKIAFVVIKYGAEVNGGGEVHCRMLAERLTQHYDVEVLTSDIINFEASKNSENTYPIGDEIINDVTVKRFSSRNKNSDDFHKYRGKAKWGGKIRRQLYKLGVLKYIANCVPLWNMFRGAEIRLQACSAGYSSDLLEYIRLHEQDYKALIFITYYFPHTQIGGLIAPHKSIVIPTAHNEKPLFYSNLTYLFTKVKHVAFNTNAEENMCEDIFGSHISEHSIVGVGVELASSDKWDIVKQKYSLPDSYILYLGRVTSRKINSLLEDFVSYKKRTKSDVKLVLVGGIDKNISTDMHPDIIFTGFVSEEEKSSIIENATIFVNPSQYESLSLLLIEGMSKGIPILVNGKCEVLKEHCLLSDGAAHYYMSKEDFFKKLDILLSDNKLREVMGEKGKIYVEKNYSWNKIIPQFINIIEEI